MSSKCRRRVLIDFAFSTVVDLVRRFGKFHSSVELLYPSHVDDGVLARSQVRSGGRITCEFTCSSLLSFRFQQILHQPSLTTLYITAHETLCTCRPPNFHTCMPQSPHVTSTESSISISITMRSKLHRRILWPDVRAVA